MMADKGEKPVLISILRLNPHPESPRISPDITTINWIAEQIQEKGKFDPEHALKVRPMPDDTFQIVAGWLRYLAAIKLNLDEIPVWIEEMNDEEAYMGLVKSNRRSELSPLEFGIHAKKWGSGAGGRGIKGGYSEYARQVGYSQAHISNLVKAVAVYEFLKPIGQPIPLYSAKDFQKRTEHLITISHAPMGEWTEIWEKVASKNLSDKDTELLVSRAMGRQPKKRSEISVRHYQYFAGVLEVCISKNRGLNAGAGFVSECIKIVTDIFEVNKDIRNECKKSIVSWIIKKGGIDISKERLKGEVRHLLECVPEMKFAVNTKKKKGYSLDVLSGMAHEEEWINEATEHALIEAISEKIAHPDVQFLLEHRKGLEESLQEKISMAMQPADVQAETTVEKPNSTIRADATVEIAAELPNSTMQEEAFDIVNRSTIIYYIPEHLKSYTAFRRNMEAYIEQNYGAKFDDSKKEWSLSDKKEYWLSRENYENQLSLFTSNFMQERYKKQMN